MFDGCIFLFFIFPAASMLNPFSTLNLYRNPKFNEKGSLITLSEFLNFTQGRTSPLGVVIIIEVRSVQPIISVIKSLIPSIGCKLCEHIISVVKCGKAQLTM